LNTFTACSNARRTAEDNWRRGGSDDNGGNLGSATNETLALRFVPFGTTVALICFTGSFDGCLAALVREESFLVLAIFIIFFPAVVLVDLGVAFFTLAAFFTDFTSFTDFADFTGFNDFDFALTVFLPNLFFAGLVLELEIDFEPAAFVAILTLPFDLVL